MGVAASCLARTGHRPPPLLVCFPTGAAYYPVITTHWRLPLGAGKAKRGKCEMLAQRLSKVAAALSLFLLVVPTMAGPLTGVKAIQVDPTVVSNSERVKEAWAANWVHDKLVAALQETGFQTGDAPIHANIVLDEFTSGSMAKRFLVGLGAGRSSITANMILEDASGKHLSATRIHVRGALIFSPYEGGNTQTRQAENSFQQKLVEEIEKLK